MKATATLVALTMFVLALFPCIALAETHYQPEPEPDQNLGLTVGAGKVGLNFYMNPYLSVKGTVLNGKDACCTGDTLALDDFDVAGEFFSKGGPQDSPPILFVPSIDEVKRLIDEKTYSAPTYRFNICSWQINREKDEGPNRCVVDGNVICQGSCSIDRSSGLLRKNDGTYEATGSAAEVALSCTPKCIIFIDRKDQIYTSERGGQYNTTLQKAYGYMEINSTASGTFDPIKASFSFGVKKTPERPKLEATLYRPAKITAGDDFFIRAVIKNSGGQKAYLKAATLTDGTGKVLYMPKELAPGAEAEVIIKAKATADEMSLDLNYEAENLGCLNNKKAVESFSVGKATQRGSVCSMDADCPGAKCCAGACRAGQGVCDDIDGDGVPDKWIAR